MFHVKHSPLPLPEPPSLSQASSLENLPPREMGLALPLLSLGVAADQDEDKPA